MQILKVEHALNGGKRLRSVIALVIGEQLDKTKY